MTVGTAPVPPGVDAIFGEPFAGVPVYHCSLAVAELLAWAHARVHGRPAAVHHGDGHMVTERHSPLPVDTWQEPPAGVVDQLEAAGRISVLAGPGVVTAGGVPGLHAFATAGSLGVLNTWGAKGVFDWRSRHHLATAGLQARDFELAGFGDADLIVATGVDSREAPADLWQLATVVDVPPASLSQLAECWHRPPSAIEVPPLRAGLAGATQAGWARDTAPLAPSRVTLNYTRALGAGGLVAADPGTAGYWVARTFSTTELGSVQVPADPDATGFAVACAVVSRLRRPLRPVLAVVDGPLADRGRAVLETAAALGVAVPVEVWTEEGDALDADAHLTRLLESTMLEKSTVVTLATDRSQIEEMIAVAGPIVAWQRRPVG